MADGRLIDTSDSELERQMLRAAADEKVPADVRRRALASLGLLAIAPTGAISTAAASTEGATAAAKTVGWHASLAKAGAIVGIGGAVLGVGTTVLQSPASREPQVVDVASVSRTPARQRLPLLTTDAPPNIVLEPPPACPSPTPAMVRPRAAPARPVATTRGGSVARVSSVGTTEEIRPAPARDPVPPHAGAASIREEIDLLDRARTQLARGNSRAATEIIGQYFARYPSGELRAEAELVRREARLASE